MNCTLIERNTKKGFKFRVKERPKVGFMRREVFFFSPSHISHLPVSVSKRQLPCLRLSTYILYNYSYHLCLYYLYLLVLYILSYFF